MAALALGLSVGGCMGGGEAERERSTSRSEAPASVPERAESTTRGSTPEPAPRGALSRPLHATCAELSREGGDSAEASRDAVAKVAAALTSKIGYQWSQSKEAI